MFLSPLNRAPAVQHLSAYFCIHPAKSKFRQKPINTKSLELCAFKLLSWSHQVTCYVLRLVKTVFYSYYPCNTLSFTIYFWFPKDVLQFFDYIHPFWNMQGALLFLGSKLLIIMTLNSVIGYYIPGLQILNYIYLTLYIAW